MLFIELLILLRYNKMVQFTKNAIEFNDIDTYIMYVSMYSMICILAQWVLIVINLKKLI
jgi:hypothetical protein